jgi:DNA helicase-2/ATP-dependent DNA helicase PcrA
MDANLPQDFQILDSEDQLRLLKRLIKAMNLDEKQWPPRQAMWFINGQKDEGLRPHHLQSYGNPVEQTWQKVYQAYQEACDRAGLVDFAELLLRAHELWLNKPHILQHYRERFTNILVDEFQDTNNIQYAWIRLLAGDTGKVMIVAMTTSRSTAGAGRRWKTSSASSTISRAQKPFVWSRTTARPTISSAQLTP